MIAKLEDISTAESIPKLVIIDKFGEVRIDDVLMCWLMCGCTNVPMYQCEPSAGAETAELEVESNSEFRDKKPIGWTK